MSLRFILGLLLALSLWAQYVPNQFIVEMEDGSSAPVMERRFAGRGLTVRGRTTRVAKAMMLETPEGVDIDWRASLRAMPGVKKVHRVREFKMSLDRAASIHGLEAAWQIVSQEKAGAGIKIGIIDSGIDITHPGFNPEGFTAPAGYPRSTEGHEAFTNAKVIVARSYASLWGRRDTNTTPLDRIGHGTAVAMAAAGVVHEGPRGKISGMAPGAWLGAYKIFGSPGLNEGATDAAILQAIEDAVADGMDIINLSLGTILAPRPEDDIIVQALEKAKQAGVIAVVAAGNEGPGYATLSSPATAPGAISVGASENDRIFTSLLSAGNGLTLRAMPGSRTAAQGSLSGTLTSVKEWDPTQLACTVLPAGSLTGKLVLIQRGTCTFETKIAVAQAAGATAAVIYSGPSQPNDFFVMEAGRALLPAVMIQYADGVRLLEQMEAGGPIAVTIQLTVQAFPVDPKRLADFSSEGPLPGAPLKPDLLAVGSNVLTAAQANTPTGAVYSASRYTVIDGTSFSSPITAGTLAVLKSLRPGLTVDAYRSLLIQGAKALDGVDFARQGAGVLSIGAGLQSPVYLDRTGISFDENVESLTLRSLSAEAQSLALSIEARQGSAPALSTSTVEVGADAAAQLQLTLDLASLPAGTHEGFLVLRAANGTESRVPYWYGRPLAEAKSIQVLTQSTSARSGLLQSDLIFFRVLDANGLGLTEKPVVRVVSGTAQVNEVRQRASDVDGSWGIDVTLGPGINQFEIEVPGGLTRRFNVIGL